MTLHHIGLSRLLPVFIDLDVATFHHRFDAVVGGLALLFNLGLLYLIAKHGSVHLREYKWILLAMCVSDIALSTVVFVSHPVRP